MSEYPFVIRTTTQFYMHIQSRIPSGISLSNAADNSLKDSNTIQSFKYQLKRSSDINLVVIMSLARGGYLFCTNLQQLQQLESQFIP